MYADILFLFDGNEDLITETNLQTKASAELQDLVIIISTFRIHYQ